MGLFGGSMHPDQCLRDDKFESIENKLMKIEANTEKLLEFRWKQAGISILAGILFSLLGFSATFVIALNSVKAMLK